MEPGKAPMVALLTWRTARLVRRVAERARQSEGAAERSRVMRGERRPSATRPTLASSSRERWRRRERARWRRSAEMCWRQVKRAGTRAGELKRRRRKRESEWERRVRWWSAWSLEGRGEEGEVRVEIRV